MVKHLRTSVLILLSIILSFSLALGQQEISVNPNKGLMTVNIPLYTLEVPGFKLPIGLTYAARGYKVNDPHSRFEGWTLQAGGSIKRILRGLPDDVNDTYNNRKGWMFSSLHAVPPGFTPADDNNESICTDENTNDVWLNTNYTSDKDLQPDVYVVNAPGLSCRLMIDNQGVFRAIPAQDIQIETSSSNFIITTNNGVKYTFDLKSTAGKTVTPSTNNYDMFRDEANNYSNSMNYFDCWYLSKIEVLSAGKYAYFNYAYASEYYKNNVEELNVFIKSNAVDTARENKLYEWQRSSANKRRLSSITSSLGFKVVFIGETDLPQYIQMFYGLESGRPKDMEVYLSDRMAYDNQNNSKSYLTYISVFGPGCKGSNYRFSYYGLKEYGEPSPSALFDVNKESRRTDAWGYLNGSTGASLAPKIYVYPALRNTTGAYRPYPIPGYTGTCHILPGNDKAANEDFITYGSMSKIIYPSGGSSSFEYECNSFLDEDANAEVKGGGIRIKAINHFDGINTDRLMRKEFIYKTDAGITSGKINMLPAYAISTTSYQDLVSGETKIYDNVVFNFGVNTLPYWNYLTLRTKHDLYMGESIVSYTQVTTKETGNGKIKQVFSAGKSFWDTSTSILSYAAQPCNSGNSTFIVKGYNQYPFAPIEHSEGGDLLEEYVYNESGDLLKKRELEYENYHTSPQRIYAIVRDNNLGLRQLSKYYTEIGGKLLKKTKETVYDSNLAGNSLVTQTDYDNTAFNRKVKSSLVTNSDNTQVKTSNLYSGDFDNFHASDSSNPLLNGIVGLKQVGNKDELLEQKTEVKPGGAGVFKVVSAQAKVFNMHTLGSLQYPVLKEVRALRNLSGLTDFTAMQRTGSTPNRVLTLDSRYETEKIFSDFGKILQPGTVNEKRVLAAIVRDTLIHMPMLQVKGADLADIGFYNADRVDNATMGFSAEYWSTNTQFTQVPYFGRAMKFIPTYHELRKIFTRKTENKLYKLVFMAKTDTATQVNILINGIVVATVPVAISAGMKFYEKGIDLSASASVDLKVTANGNLVLDNVVFFPADASFVAASYDPVYGKTMEMNSSGTIRLYEYKNGRLATERDGDGNILKAYFVNNYRETSALPYYADITVLNPTKNYAGRTMQLKGLGSCIPGTKYVWDFGDGTGTLESYDEVITHVYAAAGTYTVSLTLRHPEYADHTNTQSLQIKPEAILSTLTFTSGISKKNTCTNYKVYVNAPGRPPGNVDSPNGTKFLAFAAGCAAGGYQFKWEISDDGVSWEEYYNQPGGNLLEILSVNVTGDYYIRCRIYTPNCDKEILTPPTFIEYNCGV